MLIAGPRPSQPVLADEPASSPPLVRRRLAALLPWLAILLLLILLGGIAGWIWWRAGTTPVAGSSAIVALTKAPPVAPPSAAPAATPPTISPPTVSPPPPSSTPDPSPTDSTPPPSADAAPAPAPAVAAPATTPPSAAVASPATAEPPAAAKPAVPEPAMPESVAAPVVLGPVPDPALITATADGPLPIVGTDGRESWRVYARPFADPEKRPRIAIMLGDLGLSAPATNAAIEQLPPPVTLGFAPYAADLQNWIGKARTAGHEVMLQLPMEPLDYPASDPGPHALLTNLSSKDNIRRLDWQLSRAAGYIGVASYMGAKFTTAANEIRPVLAALRDRGLMFLDSRSSPRSVAARIAADVGLPQAAGTLVLDDEASRVAIDARLAELERTARQTGTAIGIGYPYPVTIERVAAWAGTLAEKGLALAPISAAANRQMVK